MFYVIMYYNYFIYFIDYFNHIFGGGCSSLIVYCSLWLVRDQVSVLGIR